MCEGKRSEKIGIWVTEKLLLDLTRLANAEDMALSAYLERELRRHCYGHAPRMLDGQQGADRPDSGR